MEEKFWIYVFLISIALQNCALITTKNFGIAMSTILLLFLTYKYKLIGKFNKRFIFFVGWITLFVILSSLVNVFFDLKQVIRMYMIIFDGYASYAFVRKMSRINNKIIWSAFIHVMLIMCLYGLYQYIAVKMHLPHFMNIFNNNTSYKARGIYDYFGGWTKTKGRIYGVCSEPSFYALLLCICFAMAEICPIKKKSIDLLKLLILVNVFLTSSRSGWTIILCILFMAFLVNICKKNHLSIEILEVAIYLLPCINLMLMGILVYTNYYNDVSAYTRVYSSLYYLEEAFKDPILLIVGHGLGYSWSLDWSSNKFIEAVPHNGYIEIMYSLGVLCLIVLIYAVHQMAKKIKYDKAKVIFIVVAVSLCIFGSDYNIESIIELFGCLYICCLEIDGSRS